MQIKFSHMVGIFVLVIAGVAVGFTLHGNTGALGGSTVYVQTPVTTVNPTSSSGGQLCAAAGAGTPTFNPTAYEENFAYPRALVSETVKYTGYVNGIGIPAAGMDGVYTGAANSITVSCGSNQTNYYGNNVDFFLQQMKYLIRYVTTDPYVNETPISAPSLTFSNSSPTEFNTQGKFYSQSNGASDLSSQLQVKISPGSAGYFGYPCMDVAAEVNTSLVPNIYPTGISGSGATESISNTTVNTGSACPITQVFSVPNKMLNLTSGYTAFVYQVPAVSTASGPLTLTYKVQTGSLPANTALSANVDFVVISQTGYNSNNQFTGGAVANATGSALVSTVTSYADANQGHGVRIYG